MTTLPADLAAWTLIARAPDRLYAVSARYGGTLVCTDIKGVIRSARALISFVEWYEAKEKRLKDT